MRLRRLRLRHWRGIEECDVSFAEKGVTVVEGPNESGKSSLLEALDVLLEEQDSTSKARVRSVRPVHRDEGSEVEAEFATGTYEVVYRKRFFKKPSTELKVRAPRAESLVGREAHERVRAILAETLDLDLWRALRVDQGSGLVPADLGKATWLGAALEKAAGGTGTSGEPERTLLAAAEAEALRWWTPTGREHRDQTEAADRVAALEAEVAKHREDLARVEGDVETAARLAKERTARAAAAEDLRRRAEELDAAVRRLDALRVRRADRERARAVAESALRAAETVLRERTDLAKDLEKVSEEVAHRERALAESAPGAAAAGSALAVADAALAAARTAAAAATALAELRERDFEHRRDELDLAQLSERAERIARAEEEAHTAAEILRRNGVDDETLAKIRKAREHLVRAQAVADAASPSLRLDAAAALEVRIDEQPASLAAGERREIAVAGTTRVEVPGLLRVEVVAGTGAAEPRKDLEKRRAALADLCAAAGVADADAAERAHAERREAGRLLSERDRKVAENLRDLTREQIERKIANLRARVTVWPGERPADPPLPEDFDASQRTREDAKSAAAAAVRAVADAERRRDEARRANDEAATRMRGWEGQLDVLRGQAAEKARALAEARRVAEDGEISRRRDAADAALRAADASLVAVLGELEAAGAEKLETLAANARTASERAAADLRAVEQEQAAVAGRLDATVESGIGERLAAKESELAHAQRDLAARRGHAAAAKALVEALRNARDEARARYVAPFRERIESLGQVVFGPSFGVEVGEDLSLVSRTVADAAGTGRTVPFESLSGGAREQLGVIARLACAALVEEQGGVPVILDDALGFSDPRRLEEMGALLSLAGRRSQVIVLTCFPDRYRHVGGATVVRMG